MKHAFNELFKLMERYLTRQSERDFPRRSTITDYTTSKRMTAMEHRGNQLCFVVVASAEDGKDQLKKMLTKYVVRTGTAKKDAPTVDGMIDSVRDTLCAQKWMMEQKPVGEVMAAEDRVVEVLTAIKKAFPRGTGTEGWNIIQKFHGCFRMLTTQQLRLGNGEGWDGSHIERMHKTFFKDMGKQTQRRAGVLAQQIAQRNFENYTVQTAILKVNDELMKTKGQRKIWKSR